MYAVIRSGGKQYKVEKDDVVAIDKLKDEIGKKVDFEVLALSDGDSLTVDEAELASAKVTGEIIDQFKDDKVIVFKFKKRKGYKRLRGHRQDKTLVRIAKIAS